MIKVGSDFCSFDREMNFTSSITIDSSRLIVIIYKRIIQMAFTKINDAHYLNINIIKKIEYLLQLDLMYCEC
jgi:hypothetical protein